MLKFGQKEVTSKDFYGQREITDIFATDINKLVVSDKVPVNNGKDCRYNVSYQVDVPIQCHSISLRKKSGCLSIKRFGMKLVHSYLKNS